MAGKYNLPLLDLIGTVHSEVEAEPYIDKGQILVKDPAPLTKSGIIISNSFVKKDTIDVVLYLHGHRAPPIDEYLAKRKFKTIIDDSKKSFVFIAPQLGPTSEFLTTKSAAVDYLNRMLDMLVSFGPYTTAPKIRHLVLAAHSGGGAPMLNATDWYKGEFPVKEAWALDCLYGAHEPVGAPRKEHLYEPDTRTVKLPTPHQVAVDAAPSLAEWKLRIAGSVEETWYRKSKAGLIVKVYWGNGGTLTRTANLDLLDHLDQTSCNLELHPEFYECPTPENPVLIVPRPQPRAQHDALPQTVLGECIKDCRFLE